MPSLDALPELTIREAYVMRRIEESQRIPWGFRGAIATSLHERGLILRDPDIHSEWHTTGLGTAVLHAHFARRALAMAEKG